MFDNFHIQPYGIKNETVDGKMIGFKLVIKNANYWGESISLHDGAFIYDEWAGVWP